jgi:hypothetical protein
MPSSCKGTYKRIAVLLIDPAKCPAGGPLMISERARGVIEIIETWENLNCGTTDRCAYAVAMREAEALVESLETLARNAADWKQEEDNFWTAPAPEGRYEIEGRRDGSFTLYYVGDLLTDDLNDYVSLDAAQAAAMKDRNRRF